MKKKKRTELIATNFVSEQSFITIVDQMENNNFSTQSKLETPTSIFNKSSSSTHCQIFNLKFSFQAPLFDSAAVTSEINLAGISKHYKVLS